MEKYVFIKLNGDAGYIFFVTESDKDYPEFIEKNLKKKFMHSFILN